MFIRASWLAWLQNTIPVFGDHVNNILPGQLWVGDISTALNYKWLKQHGITHIVSVTSFDDDEVRLFPQEIAYHVIFAHDNTESDLLSHWTGSTAFIDNALKSGGSVLVHCKFGRSRSIATAAAYLIWAFRGTPKQILTFLQLKRHQASPNSFFVFQLYLWALFHKRQFK